jgi:hypothetical protein
MKPIKHSVLIAVLVALVFAAVAAALAFERINKRNDGFHRDADRIAAALYWVRPYFSERYPDERQFVAALLSQHPTPRELRNLAQSLRERRKPSSTPDYLGAPPSWDETIAIPPTPAWQHDKLTKAEIEYYDTIARLRPIVWDYQQSPIPSMMMVAAGSFIVSFIAILPAVSFFRRYLAVSVSSTPQTS